MNFDPTRLASDSEIRSVVRSVRRHQQRQDVYASLAVIACAVIVLGIVWGFVVVVSR